MKSLLILLTALFTLAPLYGDGSAVEYTVGDTAYQGYYTSPADNAPLVLLLHDWDGLTDYEIKRAEMLADLGYAVFAADLFGKGVRPTKVVDKRQHTGELYQDREKMRRLVRAALETAENQGADTTRTVVMGYCFGGAAVLEFARAGADMKGFVTFHGGLGTPEGQTYADAKGQFLVFHGSADTAIPLEDFADLARQLESHDLSHELVTYGGAPHAFTVYGSDRYHAEADERSWARFTRFLEETLGRE